MGAKWDVSPVKFAKLIEKDARELKSNLAYDAYAALVEFSPVKTGRLRFSWNHALNSIDTRVSEENKAWKKRGDPVLPPPQNHKYRVRLGDKVFLSNYIYYGTVRETGSDGARAAQMLPKMLAKLKERYDLE